MTRLVAASSRAEAAEQLVDVYERIAGLHREDFPSAQRLVEPPAVPVYEADVLKRQQREKLKGISLFARARRKDALARAAVDAQREVDHRRRENARQQMQRQREHDEDWARLTANDPEAVLGALAAAFEDNDAAAAPLGVANDEAALVVIVPTLAAMPQKKPAVTPTGRPTIRAVPKKEASSWHATAVAGCVLVTVKEAFAVAPGLEAVRIVAATTPERDVYGQSRLEVLVAAKFERSRLQNVRWETTESIRVLNDVSTELQLKQVGAARTLAPLVLDDEPELRGLLNAIDYEELGA